MRGGQRQTLSLQPTALTQGIVNYDPFYQYGIVVDDRTPNQIVVQRVYPRTPAYYAGLRAGDVITTFGGQPIVSVDAFSQSLVQANGMLDLGVTRNGQAAQVQLDSSSISVDGSARTTFRPNLDVRSRPRSRPAAPWSHGKIAQRRPRLRVGTRSAATGRSAASTARRDASDSCYASDSCDAGHASDSCHAARSRHAGCSSGPSDAGNARGSGQSCYASGAHGTGHSLTNPELLVE